MMDIENLIYAVKLCGRTPKVDQCKQCAYWSGGDMGKCIPRMTTDAAAALSTLQAENEKLRALVGDWKKKYAESNEKWITVENKWAGLDKAVKNGNIYRPMQEELNLTQEENQSLKDVNEKLGAELEQVKRALAMMWYAYGNKDMEFPHEYEIEAATEAEKVLGPWSECMPKYLRHGQKEG